MAEENVEVLATSGDMGAVQLDVHDGARVIHLHIGTVSLRMCAHKFERLTVLLNEAMLNLDPDDPYPKNMLRRLDPESGGSSAGPDHE